MKLISVFVIFAGGTTALPNVHPIPLVLSKRMKNIDEGRYKTEPRTHWYVGCTASSKCYFTYDAVPTRRVNGYDLARTPVTELLAETTFYFGASAD
jgi:hypothetical protein